MCYRRLPLWRRAGVVFVHVPKAAGTSINHALYGRSMGHLTAQEIQRYCPGLLETLASFAVVRNPWSRLVSAYSFVRQAGTTDAGVRNPEQYRLPAFRSFASFVDEWLVEQELDRLDFVFRPQHRFTDGPRGALVEYVGRVEKLDELSDYLEQRMGKRWFFEQRNASRKEADYRAYFDSKRLIQRVGDLYASDVKRFDYDF
jgi:hypothetical protein